MGLYKVVVIDGKVFLPDDISGKSYNTYIVKFESGVKAREFVEHLIDGDFPEFSLKSDGKSE